MHVIIQTIAIFVTGIVLAGCAGRQETAAFAEVEKIEKSLYRSERQPSAAVLPEIDANATLETYLACAAINNPGLRAAFQRWKAALERVSQARALPDPRFNYAYFIREVETRVGPQRQKFSLNQNFPWFGTLKLRGDAALGAANAAHKDYEAVRLKLFYQVREVFYEYCYLGRAVEVMQENLQLLTFLENVVRSKYRAGTTPHSSLIKAQVELERLQDRLRSLNDLQNPLKARLNAALNRPMDAYLPPPEKLAVDTIQISDQQWSEWLREYNPELQGEDFLAAKEAAAVELARKNYFPDITLGVEYIDTDVALNPNVADSGKDPLIAMVSINLPLWFGKNRAAVSEAEARRLSVIQNRRNKENDLQSRLQTVLYHYREAERKITLYRDSLLPRARQALNVAQAAFETGKVDFLNLIDAQRTLLEFELSLEQALADYARRLAELEMLSGQTITQGENSREQD